MDPISFDILNWKSIAMLMPILCTLLLVGNALHHGAERRSICWLLLFTLAASVTVTPMIIGFAGAYDRWPDLTFLPTDFSLFFGPLLYFHGRSLMLNKPLNNSAFWWLLPGICHLVYQLVTFTAFNDYQNKWTYSRSWHEPYIAPLLIYIAASLAGLALMRINSLMKRYLARLSEQRADELQFDAVWFTHLNVLAPILLVIWLVSTFAYRAFNLGYDTTFWFDLLCLFGLFILVAEATSRIHRQFPKLDEELILPLEQATASQSKDWEADGVRIKNLVVKEKWYLQQDLSVVTLSRKVGSNQSYVSKAFNLGLGQSFSHVINELRVEYAKSLIEEGGFSLLEIANIAGFGSKSSFNRAFATHVQQTPSQYKVAVQTLQNQKIRKYS